MRAFVLVAFLLTVQTAAGQGLGRGTVERPVTDWPFADPDSLGLDAAALQEHAERCAASHASACVVAYRGFIVQEWYAESFPGDPVVMQPWIGTRSATKSLVGLLTGILVDEGTVESIDEPIARYLPEWEAGVEAGVTLRHLLSMTSGVARNPPGTRGPGVVAARNLDEFVFALPLDTIPGVRWNYSNESAQLISPLLERAAGTPLAAFARERLFDPIGMRTTTMLVDEYYNTVTIGGTETRVREFARVGQLLLNRGDWNGETVVSQSWLETMLTPSPLSEYYGLTWWLHADDGAVAAAGTFDQILYVFPELDLVTMRLQRDGPQGPVRYWDAETRSIIRRIVPQD